MSIRRRIIFVINAFERDAPNSVIIAIGEAMEQRGWEVLYVAWSRGGPLEILLSSGNARTAVLGKGLVSGSFSLARIIRKFQPDIVHSSLARPTIGTALTRILTGRNKARCVASDHGIHEWHEKGRVRGFMMEQIMPAILCTTDMVIAVSESAAGELSKRGLPGKRLHVIPNGVNARRFYPRSKADRQQFLTEQFPDSPSTDEIFLIGSAGNLRRVKAFDVLITALQLVLEQAPNVRVVLWGDGPGLESLKRQSQIAGVDHAIRFCGYDAALERKLPLLDLYLQPSRTESFGLAAAEAMACAIPVIVSDAGGLRTLVKHGESGRMFPVDDYEKLAEEILYMINDKRQRLMLGNAGRLRVLQHFTQQRMTDAMAGVYNELISQGGV